MKRHVMLFSLSLGLFLVGALASAGLVLAQPGSWTDLGFQPGPNGTTLHWYSVEVPDGYYGAMSTQQPDGSLKNQFLKTKAEFDAALAAVAKSSGSTETTVQETAVLQMAGGSAALAAAGTRTATVTQRLWHGGKAYNSLTTRLTYTYNGTNITSRSGSATSGWASPWTNYGGSTYSWKPSSLPASYSTLDWFQAYRNGDYRNALRNITTAYGSGSYSWSSSTWAVDSRLSGWTRTITHTP